MKVEAKKKRLQILAILMYIASSVPLLLLMAENSEAYAGRVCGTVSPCSCGANCSGGNELFGNSQA